MRLALFSDVHGNPTALDAVLEDIQVRGGVDVYWVLGDLVAIGYDPVATLERLVGLPSVCFVRGNTDRYVVTGERPPPTLAEAQADPCLVPQLVDVAHSFAWTQGYVAATGWQDWLAELPLEQRLTLPDGTRLLGVHAVPGSDDGSGLRPDLSDAQLEALLDGCSADLVCAGHTHWPLDLDVCGVQAVNVGSVGNPWAVDLRASYVLLDANPSGYLLEHHRVGYDRSAVIEAIQRSRHPAGEFILRYYRGQHQPPWGRTF
jgi:predicted phosphodiesterase